MQRVVWGVIVAFFAYLAVAAPVKIVREQREADDAETAAATEPAETSEVVMAGLRYAPDDLVVDRGATVRFENDDVAPHTVTATDGGVDSGTLNPGQSFTLTVEEPFEYACAIHPSMQAAVRLSG